MNLLKRFPFSVSLLLLILLNFVHHGAPTLILSSLIAMTGGLGAMTLGGLMMMLMAANQQQNGQNLFRNLGTIPAPGPPTGISIPTGDTSAATPSTTTSDGNNILADIQNLIVRRRRSIEQNQDAGSSTNESTIMLPKISPAFQYRVMRQVANSDPLGCLPQALCGISAIPPSSQSGFLNDYAYLLKTVFTRDEDTDDLDQDDDAADIDKFDELKENSSSKKKKKPYQITKSDGKSGTKGSSASSTPASTKKKKTATKTKKKNPEDESEEETPLNDEEIDKLTMKEAFEIDHLANEELLEEDPDFLPYAMKDASKLKFGPYGHLRPPGRPQDIPEPYEPDEYVGIAPSDLNKMSEAELDDVLARLGGPGSGPPPGFRGSGPVRHSRPPSAPQSSNSFLSKLMPKVSMGFSPGKGGNFEEDPFFSGFKRSMRSDEVKARPPTEEEQKMFKDMIVRRRQRIDFILSTKKELSETKDPVEKFRIAADFGERVKSPRQCRILFNNCPFNYTQVLEMIAGLRKVVLGQPLTPEKVPEKDIVVTLAPVTPAPTPPPPPPPPVILQPQGMKNIINLNTGAGGGMSGMTSIQHELPTGEMVEINLQMSGSGTKQKRRRVNRPRVSTVPPTSKTVTAKPKRKHPPPDVQDLFDEDDGFPSTTTATPPPPTTSKPKASSLGSLDSLKATMLAIEKINNVTVERRKQGKPVNYVNVLADLHLDNKAPIKTVTPHPHPVTRPWLKKQNKPLINYQSSKKTSSLAAALSVLSASTSTLAHSEDDEVEETLPTRRPSGSGLGLRVKRPPFPPKNKHVRVPPTTPKPVGSKQSTKTKTKGQSSKNKDEEEADEDAQDESEDEEDESEEEEEDNYERHEYRSGVPGSVDPGDIEKVVIDIPMDSGDSSTGPAISTKTFVKRRSPPMAPKLSKRQGRKPRKLYPEKVTEFRRTIPL